jgi:cytochrome c5
MKTTCIQISAAALAAVAAMTIAVLILCCPGQLSAEPPAPVDLASSQTNSLASQTNSAGATAVQASPPRKVKSRHQLTGAELYSMNCNRCHPERYPTERTAAQWKTIMLHMQVRANLPVSQAKLILKYLQDNSGR